MSIFRVHTATVYRRPLEEAPEDEIEERLDAFGQRQVEDAFGQPVEPSVVVGTFMCRLSRPTGGETNQERSHDVAEDTRMLYTDDLAISLREDDEVSVVDRYGVPLVTKARVKLLKKVDDGVGGRHHYEVKLVTQRPSGGLNADEASTG